MSDVFIDPRDGNVYKTVEINGQIWMAENLKYKGPAKRVNGWTIEEKEFYFAPNGDRNNIDKYGCLYTWYNALKSVPDGWHLPSKEDFKNLLRYAGSDKVERFKALAAVLDWYGYNILGFDALPAGYYYSGGKYRLFCDYAVFWSSTKHDLDSAYLLILGDGYADMGYSSKDSAYSIRCIKD